MGGSVGVKSTIGQGSEFIINMKTSCQVKDVKITRPKEPKEDYSQNVLEYMKQAEQALVFLEKPASKEELTSCIDNFVVNNINEGNMEMEHQINELGDNDIQDDFIPKMEKMISSAQKIKSQISGSIFDGLSESDIGDSDDEE